VHQPCTNLYLNMYHQRVHQPCTKYVPIMHQIHINYDSSRCTNIINYTPHVCGAMAGRGKSADGKKSVSRSSKAGLQFPVGRIARFLKAEKYAERVGGGAPVYLVVVLEYLVAEVLELAGNAARDNKKTRIIPRHIQLAVRNDEELSKLLVTPDPKSSLSGGVRDMQMERNPNGEKEVTVLCRAEVDQQPPMEKDPEMETQPVPVDEVSVVLPAPGWKKWFISSRRLAADVEETEEGGSNSFSGEREPAIWDQINAENRRRVWQVLNPSRRRRLDLKIGSHSNSRDLRDLRLLGDSPPSLWCRNLVKSNARARFHSEYRGKTSSEITTSFPLFIKTIAWIFSLLAGSRLRLRF
jgi:histone H2A